MSHQFSNYLQYRISAFETQQHAGDEYIPLELDSHADSPVVGPGAYILSRTGKKISVNGFTDELGKTLVVEVVDACVCYDCEHSGLTYLLIVRNALYINSMKAHLIPPFVMRLNGLIVDECPKFLSKNPTIENHSIFFPDNDIRIPLKLHGITSYIDTRKPTMHEVDSLPTVLRLSPDTDSWNPHDTAFSEQEDAMLNYRGELKELNKRKFIVSACGTENLHGDDLSDSLVSRAASSGCSTFSISSVKTKNDERSTLKPEILASNWNIAIETARRTIQNTTHRMPRNTNDISLYRRYPANDRALRYRHLDVDMFSDTMFASKRCGKSVRNFTCAQVFATDFDWVHVVPMMAERDAHLAYKSTFKEFGVPRKMIVDGARAETAGETKKLCDQSGCSIHELEKNTPSSNRAERAIQSVKKATKRDLIQSDCPLVFWCLCLERRSKIHNHSVRNSFNLTGMTPHSKLTGDITDISHLCNFKWYEWVKYYITGEDASFPMAEERLGRCLGPCDNKGNKMSQLILTDRGEIVPIQTLRSLTPAEMANESEIQKRIKFNEYIQKRYGDSRNPPPNWIKRRRRPGDPDQYEDEDYDPDSEPATDDAPVEFSNGAPDLDLYLNAEVLLPTGDGSKRIGEVTRRLTDDDGMPLGQYNQNPFLDSRQYEVMFTDGSTQIFNANIIAENLYSQIDENGQQFTILDQIVTHRKTEDALTNENCWMTNRYGVKRRKHSTAGWEFLVDWKDGTQSWLELKTLKESNPIEVAEYIKAQGLELDPSYVWWVPSVLKRRDRIVAAVQHRVLKQTHKFGVEVPTSVIHAYKLDERNKNTFWRDAIKKEMDNVMIAFEVLGDDDVLPKNSKLLGVHMVFTVKMDLTRKARLVADGHRTPDPDFTTYAGVVSRETVRIALTYAALNGLKVLGADIQNAYLTAPSSESYHIICGEEFGSELKGKRAIVRRALYGMKSAGRDFRNHLRDCMEHMGYKSCRADPDLWVRVAKRQDGSEYYEYMLLYVDDALAINEDPHSMLNELGKYFTLKPGSVGPPKIYLGGKLSQVLLPNGVEAWAISASQYVQEAVGIVERHLKERNMCLSRDTHAPMKSGYRPELDDTELLKDDDASHFASMIGMLRWIVEMGRIDVAVEVSMLSSYVVSPRHGHYQEAMRVFSYLKIHHNARLVFDPTYPNINEEAFEKRDWSDFYPDMKDPLPDDAPKPLGLELLISAYVDADHAGDKSNRRSRSGFIIMLNMAPVYWFTKKQTVVETSSFGSEFIAMRQCCEYLRGLRYKLRMMGIPVNNPAFISGDNQSVLWNTTVPESQLKKKTSSVAYHYVREGVSSDEWRTAYVETTMNPSDILTKALPAGPDRYKKVRIILYDIYPEWKYP